MVYDIDLKRVIDQIKEADAKSVVIQLPEGLRPRAKEIYEAVLSETSAKPMIWLGSCYGACDIPNLRGVDMLVAFGHSTWKF